MRIGKKAILKEGWEGYLVKTNGLLLIYTSRGSERVGTSDMACMGR